MMRRHGIILGAVLLALSLTCRAEQATTQPTTAAADADFARQRAAMVTTQLAERDITSKAVLDAMGRVPRHRFVLPRWEAAAYDDGPLPINHGQTISQPYIVALMTQLADPKPGDRVLDIGTGSGYQAAVLAEMGSEVYSIEIIPQLADEAKQRLAELKYDKVVVRAGDGYRGWPDKAPFSAIILAAAAPRIPEPLIEQLAVGGKLVIPVGETGGVQELLVVTKQADGSVTRDRVAPVAFVPMTGEVRKQR
jgi:protein-L-isoaspartate(D-aspartate) O-methyltransferase